MILWYPFYRRSHDRRTRNWKPVADWETAGQRNTPVGDALRMLTSGSSGAVSTRFEVPSRASSGPGTASHMPREHAPDLDVSTLTREGQRTATTTDTD